jgi:UPF0716 protein FxsA
MKFLFLLLFIGVPIAEIATFIEVGGLIGLWPTLAVIVLTAVIGTALLRRQGLKVLEQAQVALSQGRPPVSSVVDGVFLLIAAALLLTPGFLTDAVGFLLLIEPFRRLIAQHLWRWAQNNMDVEFVTPGGRTPPDPSGPVIDGEIIETDKASDAQADRPSKAPGSKPQDSPWRSS